MASLNTRLEVGSRLYRLWRKKENPEEQVSHISHLRGFRFGQRNGENSTGSSGTVRGDHVVEFGPWERDDTDGSTLCEVSSEKVPAIPNPPQHPINSVDSHQGHHQLTLYQTGGEVSQDFLKVPSARESRCTPNCSTASFTTQQRPTQHEEAGFDLAITALDLATICTAYDDLGHLFPYEEMSERLRNFSQSATIPQRLLVEKAFLEAATDLSEAWVDEFFRTTVAVLGYVIAVAIAFVKTIAPWDPNPNPQPDTFGNHTLTPDLPETDKKFVLVPWNFTYSETNPRINTRTSHSIAFAISYCWVIAAVILSAAAGGFANHRTVEKALHRLKRKLPLELKMPEWESAEEKSMAVVGATGMNYSYRPGKSLPHDHSNRGAGSYGRTLVVVIPLASSFICAFLISWYTPTVGFGCRSLHQLCLFCFWILSHATTLIIRTGLIPGTRKPSSQYTIILTKNTLVTATHVTFLCLAFLGWYNRCLCWSAWLSRQDEAYVWLYTEGYFLQNLRTTWPALAFAAIASQFLFAGVMIWGKPRCRIFKRTEEEQVKSVKRLKGYERHLSADCYVCNR